MANQSTTVTSVWGPGQGVKRWKVSFVADDTTAAFAAATLTGVYGYISRIVVVPSPGTPAGPTNGAWDMAVTDEHGASVIGAATEFTNMSATVAAVWIPDNFPYIFNTLTLTPTGNAVNSAEADVYVYVEK